MRIIHGSTDVTVYFKLIDPTTGAPETGLTVTSLTVSYVRDASARVGSSGVALASATAAHSDYGIAEVDSTNCPGLYRVDFPDAAFVSGVDNVQLILNGVAIDPAYIEVEMGASEWDKALTSHDVAGTFGERINNLGTANDMADAVWDEDRSAHTTAGTFGEHVLADTIEISGDASAADNLEATYDGTGYENDVAPAQQQQISSIAIGSSSISTVAESVTISTGSETGTYSNTHARDGVYHQITDSAGVTDLYYQFDIGGTGVPSSVTHVGRSNGGNDPMSVYGWNWSSSQWEQIGDIAGQSGSTDIERTFSMYTSHVGTGANLGKVRVRFQGTGLTSANFYTDQLYVSYAVVDQSVGYANGSIWIDTLNGTSGTTAYVNGTADNPVDNISDAITLSGTMNINRFEVAQGSSVTLTASVTNYAFRGLDWNLDFNNQTVTDTTIVGANVQGICVGGAGSLLLISCQFIGATTIPEGAYVDCALSATITLGEEGTFVFNQCFSAIAGTSAPIIDTGALVANINLNIRHYSGGIDLRNFGQVGTDTMSLEGHGQLILNANCIGGTIAIRGAFQLTDNSATTTISSEARFCDECVEGAVWDGLMASHDVEDSFGNVMNDLTEESTDVYRFNANALSEAPTGGGTSSEIADAVWDELTSGHVTSGSFGEEVQTHATSTELSAHDAKLDTVDANVDSILEDTGTTIPAQISALNDLSQAEANAACDQALADYDGPTKAEMDAGFAGLNDPTASEIADAVIGEVLTEPATGLTDKSLGAMIWHLFSRFYNRVTQTSTTQTVYESDSTTVLGSMTTSDDGTTQTKGKA